MLKERGIVWVAHHGSLKPPQKLGINCDEKGEFYLTKCLAHLKLKKL